MVASYPFFWPDNYLPAAVVKTTVSSPFSASNNIVKRPIQKNQVPNYMKRQLSKALKFWGPLINKAHGPPSSNAKILKRALLSHY